MILLSKPSPHLVSEFLAGQINKELTYEDVGMTRHSSDAVSGFTIDHNRIKLGEGEVVFNQATEALKNWQQFNLGWVNVGNTKTPIKEGSVVGVYASFGPIHLLFACRIVFVVDEDGATKRYGFAYGTLPGHPECGEERFTVEWNTEDNSVWYDILAMSQPAWLSTKLAYPLTRSLQKRFARDSKQAMAAAT